MNDDMLETPEYESKKIHENGRAERFLLTKDAKFFICPLLLFSQLALRMHLTEWVRYIKPLSVDIKEMTLKQVALVSLL